MSLKILPRVLLLLLCLSAVSCVLGRRELSVSVPAGSRPAAKGQIGLGAIVDQRRFESKPSDPSTPSIKGDMNKVSAAERSRIIGRQRNGFGKAMGDIGLSGGATVPDKVRELVTEALARRGYQTSGPSANAVSVDVQKFWSWMTPGMWALTLEAQIECVLTVRRGGNTHRLVVRGHGENFCQAAVDRNWNQAYERAVEDFLTKLVSELAGVGF